MTLVEIFFAPIHNNITAQAALIAMLILILLDWVFGIGNACANHEFSSEKMREGISHKCSELGFVLVGMVSDAMLFAGLDIGLNGPVLITITLYICIMEIGSLLETFVKMNPLLGDSPIFKLLASAHMITIKHDEEPEDGPADLQNR